MIDRDSKGAPAAAPRDNPRHKRLTRAELVVVTTWVLWWVLAIAWAIWAVLSAGDAENVAMPLPMLVTGLTLLAVMVLGLPGTCGWLAARRRWSGVMLLILGLSGATLAWYVVAMLAVAVPPGQADIQDDAAGAGLVLISIPTFAVIAALGGIGAGIGVATRRMRERRTAARQGH